MDFQLLVFINGGLLPTVKTFDRIYREWCFMVLMRLAGHSSNLEIKNAKFN